MRKQNLIIGIFVSTIILVALLLHAGTTHKTVSTNTNCTKTCEQKPTSSAGTGFFIFDSFSGGL
jgi:hypothetical protein